MTDLVVHFWFLSYPIFCVLDIKIESNGNVQLHDDDGKNNQLSVWWVYSDVNLQNVAFRCQRQNPWSIQLQPRTDTTVALIVFWMKLGSFLPYSYWGQIKLVVAYFSSYYSIAAANKKDPTAPKKEKQTNKSTGTTSLLYWLMNALLLWMQMLWLCSRVVCHY